MTESSIWARLKTTELLFEAMNNKATNKNLPTREESQSNNPQIEEILDMKGILDDEILVSLFNMGIEAGLADFFAIAVMDMKKYMFEKTSSIPDSANEKNRAHLKSFENYEKLKRTNLLVHTYNVLLEAGELRDEAGYNYPTLLLLCITHDFGKNKEVRSNYQSEGWQLHEQISANYLKYLLGRLEFDTKFITPLVKILYNHHDTENNSGGKLIEMLRKCDTNARLKELGIKK